MDYIEENCTIEHQGRKFTARGAMVTPLFIVAYLGRDSQLTDCYCGGFVRY